MFDTLRLLHDYRSGLVAHTCDDSTVLAFERHLFTS
jgi:hypothetical protein